MGDLDGRMLVGGWAVQYIFSAPGSRPDRAGGCVCCGLSAAAGESLLFAFETPGQDRLDVDRKASDGSQVERGYAGDIQEPGNGGADNAAAGMNLDCGNSTASAVLFFLF